MLADVAFPVPVFREFTYELHPDLDKIAAGTRVTARFSGRNLTGTVTRVHQDRPDFKPSFILQTVDSFPFFSKEILQLSDFFSGLIPRGMLLKTMSMGVPAPPSRKREREKIPFQPEMSFGFFSGSTDKDILIIDEQRKSGFYTDYVKSLLNTGYTVVFIVPQLSHIRYWYQRLSALGENLVCIHSQQTGQEKYQEFLRGRTLSRGIILGTRQAVFFPVTKKAAFIILDEDSQLHEEESGFCYSSRQIARLRAELSGHRLIMSSAAPSADTFFYCSEKILRTYPQDVDNFNQNLHIHFSGNILRSTEFSELIHRMKNSSGDLTVRIMHSGSVSHHVTTCGFCGKIRTCKSCGGKISISGNALFCAKCRKEFLPEPCLHCGKNSLRFFSSGREKLVEILKKELPDIPVFTDSDDLNSFRNHGIIVSPLSFFSANSSVPCAETVILNPDRILLSGEWRSSELFFSLMRRSWLLLRSKNTRKLSVFFGNLSPESPYVTCWTGEFSTESEKFYTEELTARKKLGFPPFSSEIVFGLKKVSQDRREKILSFFEQIRQEIPGLFHFISAGDQKISVFLPPDQRNRFTLKMNDFIQSDLARGLHTLRVFWQ